MISSSLTCLDGIGEVDTSLTDLIARLNCEGLITLYSCSGLWSEHKNVDLRYILIYGYISFMTIQLSADQEVLIVRAAELSGMAWVKENGILRVVTPDLFSVPGANEYWESLQQEAAKLNGDLGLFQTRGANNRRYQEILKRLVIEKGNPPFDEAVVETWERFRIDLFGD